MGHRRASWLIASLLVAVSAAPAVAQLANLPVAARTTIAEMGARLDAQVIQKSFALMWPLQAPRTGLAVSRDTAYGPDPLQTLDLYRPQHGTGLARMQIGRLGRTNGAVEGMALWCLKAESGGAVIDLNLGQCFLADCALQ